MATPAPAPATAPANATAPAPAPASASATAPATAPAPAPAPAPATAPATSPATTPAIIAWTASADDQSAQCYVQVSAAVSTRINTSRAAPLSADPAELAQQTIALQRLLPSNLLTWSLSGLPSQELVAHLRVEYDEARSECEEHMTGEGRLQ